MRTHNRRGGQSLIEFALLVPWFLFLFIGALDMGFYAYALISVESAARVAALYTSSSKGTAADAGGACTYALSELQSIPNIGTNVTSCTALPVQVTATCAVDGSYGPISTVSVTYQTVSMIPIPRLLTNQFTLTRIVQMRVNGATTCT